MHLMVFIRPKKNMFVSGNGLKKNLVGLVSRVGFFVLFSLKN